MSKVLSLILVTVLCASLNYIAANDRNTTKVKVKNNTISKQQDIASTNNKTKKIENIQKKSLEKQNTVTNQVTKKIEDTIKINEITIPKNSFIPTENVIATKEIIENTTNKETAISLNKENNNTPNNNKILLEKVTITTSNALTPKQELLQQIKNLQQEIADNQNNNDYKLKKKTTELEDLLIKLKTLE